MLLKVTRERRRRKRASSAKTMEGKRGVGVKISVKVSTRRWNRMKCANTDRVNGWAEILHRLGDPTNGVGPRLFIHERCARLVECLPSLQHDPNRPEEVLKVDCDEDGNGGDDTADCLRYLVATKSRVVAQRKLRGL